MQSKGFSDPNVFSPHTRSPFRVTDAILPSIPMNLTDFDRTRARKWCTNLPQSVAELTVTSVAKNCKQPESRIQNVIKIYGATTGHWHGYRYDFEATSEVSVTDCDKYIYMHTNTRRLGHQDLLPRLLARQLVHHINWCTCADNITEQKSY